MGRKRAKKSEDNSEKLKILAGALLVAKALIELATTVIEKLTK